MKPVIMWFKRDLRLEDNRALARAASLGRVLPIFIIDPELLDELNAYDGRLAFIFSALRTLSEQIPLKVYVGKTTEVFEELLDKFRPRAIVTAAAHTWSGERREAEVERVASRYKVELVRVFDNFLADFRRVQFGTSFTSFYKSWIGMIDTQLTPAPQAEYYEAEGPGWEEAAKRLPHAPGRFSAEELEERLRYDFSRYGALRSLKDGSTLLSPYIRFGLVSVRQLYHVSGGAREFVWELGWREYFYALKHRFPQMNRLEIMEQRRGLKWRNEHLDAFFRGETGYPIVDAAIRQLKRENWIHNRMRMLLASFFTKDLLGDWRIGEEFFKKWLIDYDEVVNVGNWQWTASVGTDYMIRIFNPMEQARKFDPDCSYITTYIPELRGVRCECLHDPLSCRIPNYHPPVVDHYEAKRRALEFFKAR